MRYVEVYSLFSNPNKVSIPFLFNLKGRFVIQRQKETTGRVVFWNMGMLNSYTMEASYGGTNMGSRAFTHFTTDDYEGMGRYILCVYVSNYIPHKPGGVASI